MDPSSQMAGSSNPQDASARIHDLEYLYASNADVSNFVSVKLSSNRNYHLWKTQMLRLMKSHKMAGIVDDAYVSPRASSKEIMDQYDSLLKGWIFGSASENVLGAVVDLASAKDVWDQLKSFYDVTVSHQQGSSNPQDDSARMQDLEYLYASNANVSNFVSVKLSSDRNYHLWKSQMLCLMKIHNMACIVDDAYESPTASIKKNMDQYDSLLKGWIFGSASENVLGAIVDLASAKDVWDKLKSFYDVTVSHQQGSSNPQDDSARIQDLEYFYASNANVSNFVSVKLSSDRNYHLWKSQMLCLMKSHNMASIVDDAYARPIVSIKKNKDQYDSLLKRWIFCSASENVLGAIVDLPSAKDVWGKLKSLYDVTVSLQQVAKSVGETEAEAETNKETKDVDEISSQKGTNVGDTVVDVDSTKTETDGEDPNNKAAGKDKTQTKKNLREATMKGDWTGAESILKEDKGLVKEDISSSSDGSNILHIAVGIGNKDFVKNLFSYINKDDVVAKREDGSTALHIAAIVGNTYAAELLLKKNKECLRIKDGNSDEPLQKAYENMHLDTIGYLLKVIEDDRKKEDSVQPHPGDEMGVALLVNVISAKQYNRASDLIEKFPQFASKNDDVLMAIAKTFPSGDYRETIIPLSWMFLLGCIYGVVKELMIGLPVLRGFLRDNCNQLSLKPLVDIVIIVIFIVLALLMDVFFFLCGLILLPSGVLLYLLWWMSRVLVEPITHIEKKKKEMDEAECVLRLVCDAIDKLKLKLTGTHHPYYSRPILEAACQNAHKVVDEILCRLPEAILSIDKSGYDIIQLAVIHRSERIYNLIYDIGERKNLYRTIVDSSKNNILHLAGRLAPSSKLNKRTGAALQLQRELQWHEEVKKHVFPTYITQENIFKETPRMVFTREHEKLVKDGESWMKTTAESCSITAALIMTIVFAAAITVPGGSNQDTGMPVFTKDTAFIIFAVSDAISLFASSTTLLVFLSILTARFSEKDFLVSLPRRLLIGMCSLLLSAISMMVAFSSTLFLVFCQRKLWMLAPICGLSLIPISFFVALQLPLIVDLFRSTYLPKFGPRRRGKRARFNPDNIRLSFGR